MRASVAGFLTGSLAGIVLGILLGRSALLSDICAPFIKAANAVPRIVLASLFVIWFRLGLQSKITTVFILVFFAVFFNAFQGAREVDRNLVNNARILGASRFQVRFPALRVRVRAQGCGRRRIHRRRQGTRAADRALQF
ncbi:ABC transporter permease [Saccharopolyspora pogona]|uniref:ABC transporter permease n=1 Tax=Saccharopolyspora pogona TaxID=333966 RepID=UPI00295B4A28|nr:ABC transporter permease subunit [Saccharopolyspora pogona]